MLNTKAKFAGSGCLFLLPEFFRSSASNLWWSVFFKVWSWSVDPAVFFFKAGCSTVQLVNVCLLKT